MIHEDSAGSRMGQGTGPWVPDGVGLGGEAEVALKSAGHRWAQRSWGHCEGAGLESTINLIYKTMAAFPNGFTDWQVCSWLAVSRRTVGVESIRPRSPSYEGEAPHNGFRALQKGLLVILFGRPRGASTM
jgi:hypothetical protein